MKKIIGLLLVMTLVFGTVSYAADTEGDLTTDDIAERMNAINILRGDGKSYNLDGELTRAEGVTFIVRLMGMEEEVLENKIDYVVTNFSDVEGQDWYAPYVGYCVDEGIINGYTDGTFRPLDKLNEQAFVKMVLGALGYTYGVDYTWSEVFQFAYDNGLVTDESYDGITSKDEDYLRGEAVTLLFESVRQPKEDGSLMVDELIGKAVFTKDEAIEYGFITDSVEMAVTRVNFTGDTLISILFNEIPSNMGIPVVEIREVESQKILDITKVEEMDTPTLFLVETEAQEPDVAYELTVSGVKDTQENVMDDYSKSFYGHRSEDFGSDYFRIVSASQVKANQIDVEFTQPIDIDNMEASDFILEKNDVPMIIGGSDTMLLSVDSLNPFLLHVELTGFNFTEEDVYVLKVDSSPRSVFGAPVKNGLGDSVRFTTSVFEIEAFSFESAVYEDVTHMVLNFNKNLREVIAEQIFSYQLKDEDGNVLEIADAVVIGSGDYAGKAVRLTLVDELVEDDTYELTINQAYNSDRTESIIESVETIVLDNGEKPTFTVTEVNVLDGNVLAVVLDNYVDLDNLDDMDIFGLYNGDSGSLVSRPETVTYDQNIKDITLVMEFDSNDLKDGVGYRINIEKEIGNGNGTEFKTDAFKIFTVEADDFINPGIEKASYIGNNLVLVKADKGFALDVPNVLNTNYQLTYFVDEVESSLDPIGVTYISANYILLRFENLDLDMDYSLEAAEVKGFFGDKETSKDVVVPLTVEEM